MTAVVGRQVTLPCRTTLPTPVDWLYQKSENEKAEYVCSAGTLLNGFRERFDLDRSTFGDFSLIIHSVTKADEGVYKCLEDAGQGTEHRITLTVTGKITQHAFILLAASTAAEGGLIFCLCFLFIYLFHILFFNYFCQTDCRDIYRTDLRRVANIELWSWMNDLKLLFRSLKGCCHGNQFRELYPQNSA